MRRFPSEGPRQAEHVFGHVAHDQVGGDRRDLIETRLAELALVRRPARTRRRFCPRRHARREARQARGLVAGGAAEPDEIALIAELLALPNAAAKLDLSPQRKREKLLAGLLHQLEALARSHPVLMVFEDMHWIDPTSRDLIDLAVDRIRRLPIFAARYLSPGIPAPLDRRRMSRQWR